MDKFDSAEDTYKDVPYRKDCAEWFYFAAKGGEWTESMSWLSQYGSHCDWYGVKCSGQNTNVLVTITLLLPTNIIVFLHRLPWLHSLSLTYIFILRVEVPIADPSTDYTNHSEGYPRWPSIARDLVSTGALFQ